MALLGEEFLHVGGVTGAAQSRNESGSPCRGIERVKRSKRSTGHVRRIQFDPFLGDGCCERCVQFCRKRCVELPHKGNGSLAFVASVTSRSKTPQSALVGTKSGKEDDARSTYFMIDVALTCVACRRRHRLALPVDEVRTDGIVAVASRR